MKCRSVLVLFFGLLGVLFAVVVELIFFQDGTQAIQATLAGGVQMVVTAGPEIIGARIAGSDMTMIAGYMNTLPYR